MRVRVYGKCAFLCECVLFTRDSVDIGIGEDEQKEKENTARISRNEFI